MKPVVCFGEALIDFLNVGSRIDGPLQLPEFRQYPGGAPANAAVAVARLGGRAYFAGQVGSDSFGDFLADALTKYGVNTDFLARHASAKTALAFVLLDEQGDRSFSFHRHETADVVFKAEQIDEAWFAEPGLFHFCSNTLTDPAIAAVTEAAVVKAKAAGSLVCFDVNLRHNLWPSGHASAETVNRLVAQADILKFAKEELTYLSGGNDEAYIEHCLQNSQLVLVTDGPDAVHFYGQGFSGSVTPPRVIAKDTTAAGDAFIGAVLFGLASSDSAAVMASEVSVRALLTFATHCSGLTVTREGAFPALPEFNEVAAYWQEL